MTLRIPALTLALVAIGLLLAQVAGTARAAPPNRVYGTVTLNGQPAPPGTAIEARARGGVVCATGVVTAPAPPNNYTYQMDVPSGTPSQECDTGAVITFTVGGQTAAQFFTLDDLGTFRRLDLTAPGTPNIPPTAGATTLTVGCSEVTLSFANGTTAERVAAAVTPATALLGIWRYDSGSGLYRGYAPGAGAANDLQAVNRGDVVRVCVSAAATLNQPA